MGLAENGEAKKEALEKMIEHFRPSSEEAQYGIAPVNPE